MNSKEGNVRFKVQEKHEEWGWEGGEHSLHFLVTIRIALVRWELQEIHDTYSVGLLEINKWKYNKIEERGKVKDASPWVTANFSGDLGRHLCLFQNHKAAS